MAKVEFYHKYNEDGPDEFRIRVDGDDRLATRDDKKKYPDEYKAEKMKRAQEPPRLSWEHRKAILEGNPLNEEARITIGLSPEAAEKVRALFRPWKGK